MTLQLHSQTVPGFYATATPAALAHFRQRLDNMAVSTWQHQSALCWAGEFIEYFAGQALYTLNANDIKCFLSHVEAIHSLSVEGRSEVVDSLRLFYQTMDGHDPEWISQLRPIARGGAPRRQEQLSREAVRYALPLVEYQYQVPVALIYGSGLKPSECARIRTGDISLEERCILIRDDAGHVTHQTVIPTLLVPVLSEILEQRRRLHMKDATQNFAGAPVPPAMADGKGYSRSWRHQFLFADYQLSTLEDGRFVRRSICMHGIHKAIRMAADRADLKDKLTAQNLRLSFAHHQIQRGVQPAVLQYALGQLATLPSHGTEELAQMTSPLDTLWPWGRGLWRWNTPGIDTCN